MAAQPKRATRTRPVRQAAGELAGIVYERPATSGGWWVASMPAIPAAYSQGRTKAEAYESLLDAMAELLKAYKAQARARRKAA